MEHPQRVTELVLRGIFLHTEKELHWLYQSGANFIFPEDWAAYEAAIPVAERGNYMAAYGKRLRGEMGDAGERKGRLCVMLVICDFIFVSYASNTMFSQYLRTTH